MLVTREPRWRRLVDRFNTWVPGYRHILWSFAWWMGLMLVGLILANNTGQDPITMEAVLLLGTVVWGAAVIYFIRTREQPDAKRSKAVLAAFLAPLLAVAVVPIMPSRPLPSVQAVLDELHGSTERTFTEPVVYVDRHYFWMMADLWEAGFLVRDFDELQTLVAASDIPLELTEDAASLGQTQIRYGTLNDGAGLFLVHNLVDGPMGEVLPDDGVEVRPDQGLCVYLEGPIDGNFHARQRNLRLDAWYPTDGLCEARDIGGVWYEDFGSS